MTHLTQYFTVSAVSRFRCFAQIIKNNENKKDHETGTNIVTLFGKVLSSSLKKNHIFILVKPLTEKLKIVASFTFTVSKT